MQQLRSALFTAWSIPLLYISVLVVVYVRYGLIMQFTLGAAALVVLPVVAKLTKSKDFLKNAALFITVLLTYEGLQGLTGTLVNSNDALSLAGLDQAILGFNLDAWIQHAFASNTVTMIATFFYSLHFFLVLIAIVLFWFASRPIYTRYTYSMILTSYLALVTFILFPSAPPWFVGSAQNLLSSGSSLLPSSLRSLQQAALAIESDKFAAFPSLHVAYATLFAFYTIKLNRKLSLVSIPIFIGVVFSVLYLGQHYFVDILGGVAYAGGSALVIDRLVSKYQSAPTAKSASSTGV